ncbi:MAG: gamma-glutamyltransferase [Caldilineaceae bacterium]
MPGCSRKITARNVPSALTPIAATDVPPGLPEQHEDTTCFCVVDRWGSAVCVLQSIQSGFGSSLIAGDTGILLNNRMTYWHLDADHPNCLMPGKRVRHTMNPVIVTREGKLYLVCGTPGADTQVQTNLQLLTHVIDFGMNPQEAVEAPRWRSLQNPMESTIPHTCADLLQLEGRFPAELRNGLSQRGHELEILPDWGGAGSADDHDPSHFRCPHRRPDPRRWVCRGLLTVMCNT